ncbi:anti-sigma factor antagonist, partial [Vibrio alginolyticus]|nr:anti-sigma factor antagonist [Vibrio alginolyticus]
MGIETSIDTDNKHVTISVEGTFCFNLVQDFRSSYA